MTDGRAGTVEVGLATVGGDVTEDDLPDTEADSEDDLARVPGCFEGTRDVLRVGMADDLGGIAVFEGGAKVDVGDLTAGLDEVAGFRVEAT